MHKKKQIHGSGMDFKESFKLFETIEVSKGAKISLFDLILYVHSTIFQLCGTVLPGFNQY